MKRLLADGTSLACIAIVVLNLVLSITIFCQWSAERLIQSNDTSLSQMNDQAQAYSAAFRELRKIANGTQPGDGR
jgi:hypothetical protein